MHNIQICLLLYFSTEDPKVGKRLENETLWTLVLYPIKYGMKPEHKMFGLKVTIIVSVNLQGFEAALNKVVQAGGEPDSTG